MIELSRAGRRPAFLASVTSAAEAAIALDKGADVIDAKDPLTGALGALPAHAVAEIVAVTDGRAPVSATVGDLPADPEVLLNAASMMAAAGVRYIKVGFFGDDGARSVMRALGEADLGGSALVAVLMADRTPDLSFVSHLAAVGFAGVMLDTADKAAGGLTRHMPRSRLAAFIGEARAHGLFAGLAGSLALEDIAPLAQMGPDVMGFRGALCHGGRTGPLDPVRVAAVRAALDTSVTSRERSVA